jgi:hypothetical protein
MLWSARNLGTPEMPTRDYEPHSGIAGTLDPPGGML